MDWNPQDPMECPHCGVPCNAVCDPTGEDPVANKEGAMSLCFTCGGLSVYAIEGGYLVLRKATTSEEAEVKDDDEIVRARKMIGFTASTRLATSLLTMTS